MEGSPFHSGHFYSLSALVAASFFGSLLNARNIASSAALWSNERDAKMVSAVGPLPIYMPDIVSYYSLGYSSALQND